MQEPILQPTLQQLQGDNRPGEVREVTNLNEEELENLGPAYPDLSMEDDDETHSDSACLSIFTVSQTHQFAMQCLHFSLLCCNDGLGSCWLPANLIELSAIIDNNRNSIDRFCQNRSMKNHNRFTLDIYVYMTNWN